MRGDFKKAKNFKAIKYDNQKYKLDKEITINNLQWRIAEYRFKYGREWVYVLQYENVDGTYKTIELNEKSLTEIIESAGQLS